MSNQDQKEPHPSSLTFVHETSYVDEGAQVGAGTRIWHFCHAMPGTRIGERCTLGQNVQIGNNVPSTKA